MSRDAVDVIREAQELLHDAAGDEVHSRVIRELDDVAGALRILPDLHEMQGRRLDVLFPKE